MDHHHKLSVNIESIAASAFAAAANAASDEWKEVCSRPHVGDVWIGNEFGPGPGPAGPTESGWVDVHIRCRRIQIGEGAIILPLKFVEVVKWPEEEFEFQRPVMEWDYGGVVRDALEDVHTWFQGCISPDVGLGPIHDDLNRGEMYIKELDAEDGLYLIGNVNVAVLKSS